MAPKSAQAAASTPLAPSSSGEVVPLRCPHSHCTFSPTVGRLNLAQRTATLKRHTEKCHTWTKEERLAESRRRDLNAEGRAADRAKAAAAPPIVTPRFDRWLAAQAQQAPAANISAEDRTSRARDRQSNPSSRAVSTGSVASASSLGSRSSSAHLLTARVPADISAPLPQDLGQRASQNNLRGAANTGSVRRTPPSRSLSPRSKRRARDVNDMDVGSIM